MTRFRSHVPGPTSPCQPLPNPPGGPEAGGASRALLGLVTVAGLGLFLAFFAALMLGLPVAGNGGAAGRDGMIGGTSGRQADADGIGKGAAMNAEQNSGTLRTAVFAGGCFWCTESDFDKLPGVVDVVSGYAGGRMSDPSYEQVSAGTTGHQEAVQVTYDPARTSYAMLLDWYWRHVDPTDPGGQFFDRGDQYRTVIFVADEAQRQAAEDSKTRLAASGVFGDKPIVTEIKPLDRFWTAEAYHQDFHVTNSPRYCAYRAASGRDRFLEHFWGDRVDQTTPVLGPVPATDAPAAATPAPTPAPRPAPKPKEGPVYQGYDKNAAPGAGYVKPPDDALKDELSPMAYKVTQCSATEAPFDNEYWDNHAEGLYVDVVSGEPLFSSRDKFDSGTGWPSFTRPLDPAAVKDKTDSSHGMTRTEVRSGQADSHLGHVFDDGPGPTHKRYCINSAALRFIPKADLEREGYGAYLKLFE